MAATTKETACLLCSLCCPAGVAFDDYGLTAPEYPGHTAAARRGLCARGHYIAELAGHPGRLDRGLVRGPSAPKAVAPSEALRQAAAALASARNETAVVLDGNLPCEELAAAVRSAREGLGIARVTLYIPPSDEAVLRGLAASSATRIGERELGDCDVILAVGDPFATHPVVASSVLDALAKARGRRLAVIDSVQGKTSRFAADFCQVRPGGETAALAGLLLALDAGSGAAAGALPGLDIPAAAAMAGVAPGRLEALAATLSKAQRLAVLVALHEGRCAATSAAAALAGKLAEARGGATCPLLTYGNAAGAWRLATALKTAPLAQLVADLALGRVRQLIVLGTDLLGALPRLDLGSAEIVLCAAPLPTATTARAAFVVPMAFWFEIGGTVLDGAGGRRRAGAVARPRGGALSPSGILAALGAPGAAPLAAADCDALLAAEPSVGLAEVLGRPADWVPRVPDGHMVLVSQADCVGFAEGSTSGQLAWPALMEPRAVLWLNPREATAMTSNRATVRSDGVALTLAVGASADVPPGVAVVSPRFVETRALFSWRGASAGPAVVHMEKSSGGD